MAKCDQYQSMPPFPHSHCPILGTTTARIRPFWLLFIHPQFLEYSSTDGQERVCVDTGVIGLGFCEDNKPDTGIYRVVEKLFISSQDGAQNLHELQSKNITHILNVATGVENAFPKVLCRRYRFVLQHNLYANSLYGRKHPQFGCLRVWLVHVSWFVQVVKLTVVAWLVGVCSAVVLSLTTVFLNTTPTQVTTTKLFPLLWIPRVLVHLEIPGLLIYKLHVHASMYVFGDVMPLVFQEFHYMTTELLDLPETDIRCHFEEMFRFIDKGCLTGKVLVHW